MIKKLFQLGFILLVFIFSSCSVSRRITHIQYVPSDSLLQKDRINVAEYEKKYSKYDGVYLFVKNVMEHSGTKSSFGFGGWKYHRIKNIKYVVLNPDAAYLTTFSQTFHPKAQINSLYIVTIDLAGEIKKYSMSDLFEEKDSYGYLTYKFSLPGIKKGSIIEEGIDITYNANQVMPPIEYDVDLQYQLPCEKLEFDFAYPDWWKIITKKIGPLTNINYTVNYDEKDNKNIITYKAENIPAIPQEPFSPYFLEVAKYLKIKITNLDAGYKYSSPKDWQEYASQFRRYAMNNEGIFSSSVRSKTNELIENCKTPIEKLEAILSYVQENIEIANDYRKRDFLDVIEDSQGSIYEICGLTQAMLSKADLQTDYLLIHSAQSGYFDEDYISFDQLSIPAVKVDIDNKSYVVLPYFKNLPINHIPPFIQDQTALIVSNDKMRNGKFWTLPPGNMADNSFKEKYNLELKNDGIISVKEEKIIAGSFAYDIREYISKLKEEEIKKYLESLLTYTDGNVHINTYKIENQQDYKLPLILKLEYDINNLLTLTPDEVIFQTGGLLSPSSLLKIKIDPKERINPIKINYDQTFEKQISVKFPSEWTVTTSLKELKVDNEFGFTKGEYKISEGNIAFDETSKLHQCFKPKEKISDLLDIIGSSSKFNIPDIIFKKREINSTSR